MHVRKYGLYLKPLLFSASKIKAPNDLSPSRSVKWFSVMQIKFIIVQGKWL